MHGLLEEFWERQGVVIWKNGYHGPQFQFTRRKTQGSHILLALFNLIVENVAQNWIVLTVEDKLVAHDRMGLAVEWCLGLIYVDDGMVGSRDPECLQGSLNVLFDFFRRY